MATNETAAAPGHRDSGVTKIIDRIPKPGMEKEFEAAMQELAKAGTSFPGHLGVNVLRPDPPDRPAYRVIYKFDTVPHLRAWEESDEHSRTVDAANRLTLGEPKLSVLTGLETWFTLPRLTTSHAPPPRNKMAIATFLALYPLTYLAQQAFVHIPGFDRLPTLFGHALIVACVVGLMTYVVMPRVTRLLAFWLYPQAAAN